MFKNPIVASIEIFDNGYIGGNYETTYYKRNAEGGITGDPGTQAHGCFDYLTGGPQINLNEINNNWDFNIRGELYIFLIIGRLLISRMSKRLFIMPAFIFNDFKMCPESQRICSYIRFSFIHKK